jgi:diadenosine tetraphosphatase ApaH/serine/threonine PP2A family protein phosphatase
MDFSSSEIDDDDTVEMVALRPLISTTKVAEYAESAYAHPETGQPITEENANKLMEARAEGSEPSLPDSSTQATQNGNLKIENIDIEDIDTEDLPDNPSTSGNKEQDQEATHEQQEVSENPEEPRAESQDETGEAEQSSSTTEEEDPESYETTPEEDIQTAEDRLNSEIEELLELLGLSQSMIEVTNEMVTPPEGEWQAPTGYRAIVNPGGVGQPRDGDPRSAFMVYDTEKGFEFYRVPYDLEKTQEKIIKAGLPPYLAVRLAYGR